MSSALAESDWGREGYLPAPAYAGGGGARGARPPPPRTPTHKADETTTHPSCPPGPRLCWGAGGELRGRARLTSDSTQCFETLTASLSPASTSSDRARVSAAIMSRQV